MTDTYQFAGICVEINHIYPYFAEMAKDYLCDEKPAFSISTTQADIDLERTDAQVQDGYLESLAIYRKLCDKLVEMGVVLFHSAAITAGGKAYLFTAPSGTGKSTHIKLWRKRYGKAVGIINGDKPLISITEQEIRAWGTPWDGKEHWSANRSAPIAGICYLCRGVDNEITPMSSQEALSVLFSQSYRPSTEAGMRRLMQLLQELSQRVPFWKLKCNMSEEAAEVSYAAMRGE